MAARELEWMIAADITAEHSLIDKLLPSPVLPPGLLEIDPDQYWHQFLGPSEFQEMERGSLFELLMDEVIHAQEELPSLELVNRAWQVYENLSQEGYQYPLIFVVGALGSGKSTLNRRLKGVKPESTMFEELTNEEKSFIDPRLGKYYDLLKEHFKTNLAGELLGRMYSRQDSLQNWFANNRLTKTLKAIASCQDGPVSFDSSPPSDPVYEYVQRRLGVVRDEDFAQYIRAMQIRLALIPPVENVVYVHNGIYHVDTLKERNISRDLDIEKDMPEGYLALLLGTCSLMTRALMRSGARVILVDSEEINFSQEDEISNQAASTIWQQAERLGQVTPPSSLPSSAPWS